jgi:hypothetical protein
MGIGMGQEKKDRFSITTSSNNKQMELINRMVFGVKRKEDARFKHYTYIYQVEFGLLRERERAPKTKYLNE